MPELQYPRSIQTKLRYKLALACGAMGVVLIVFAARFQSKQFLTALPAEHRAGRAYSRMWFNDLDTLVGASQQGSRLTIERWAGSGSGTNNWQFDFGTADVQWTLARDLSRVAWISGSTLYSQFLPQQNEPNGPPVSMALPAGRKPLALSLLSDGSVAVVFADSSVERWDGRSE